MTTVKHFESNNEDDDDRVDMHSEEIKGDQDVEDAQGESTLSSSHRRRRRVVVNSTQIEGIPPERPPSMSAYSLSDGPYATPSSERKESFWD